MTLDFPPMGFRDESNKPAGFDVDYCNDLAKVLGVDAEVVETPFSDRIPALLSGRADVIVASTSDTLERAKTVGLTVPYFAFQMVVLTRDNTGITSYADLKGKALGNTSSTYEAIALEKDQKKLGQRQLPRLPVAERHLAGNRPGAHRRHRGDQHRGRRDHQVGQVQVPEDCR
nr:hypothetical protein GCM10020185_70840 [Pseudomonas brassicacearum subsp. brassicacearum]